MEQLDAQRMADPLKYCVMLPIYRTNSLRQGMPTIMSCWEIDEIIHLRQR